MTKLPPTPAQLKVENFIQQYIRENQGISPSVREIGEGVGVTSASAWSIVTRLSKRGRLKHVPGMQRTLQLCE